jgi:hypothetical protein
MGARERLKALGGIVVGLGATAAVLSPLGAMDQDSFPISSYPMFARPRGQPDLYAVVARAADGREVRLPASMVASSEPLQTKVLIQRSVELGPEAMQALCRSVAARVADSPEVLRSVEIVRRRYDPIAYFTRGPEPIEQARLSSCRVPRPKRPRKGTP